MRLTFKAEHEANPLVVFVVFDVLGLPPTHRNARNPRMRNVKSNSTSHHLRHRVRRLDPTERVDHLLADLVDDAVDWVAEELLRSYEDGAAGKDEDGELVVQPEDLVVDRDFLDFYDAFDT